jgi:hypothetical protein
MEGAYLPRGDLSIAFPEKLPHTYDSKYYCASHNR